MSKASKPIPEGYHTLTGVLTVKDAARAIDFYKQAFGATETYRMMSPDGKTVIHAEVKVGDSNIMLSEEMEGMNQSAQTLGGSPVSFYFYVENVDEAFKKALDAGAVQREGVSEMFWGDRTGTVVDPFGLQWSIATRVEELDQQEVEERAKEFFSKSVA